MSRTSKKVALSALTALLGIHIAGCFPVPVPVPWGHDHDDDHHHDDDDHRHHHDDRDFR